MDQYQEMVHTGLCQMDQTPLPGRKVEAGSGLAKIFKVGTSTPSLYGVKISYDQFMHCMKNNLFLNLPYILHFKIYDEVPVRTREECMLRYQFIKYLKDIPGAVFDFYLSDSALPAYISFMDSLDWDLGNATTFHMSVDRSPAQLKKIPLEKARGKIAISEEKLMLFSGDTLKLLPGKVDESIINDAVRLKGFVKDFHSKLRRYYHTDDLYDFDKAYLAYHYLFDHPHLPRTELKPLHITYAMGQTYRDSQGIQRLKPSSTRWESKPVGTLDHRMGVCSGQARLFNSILSNPETGIEAEAIFGTIPSGEYHCWSNFVIDHHIFQCCTTMKGLYKNLDSFGYTPDQESKGFSRSYPHAYLTNDQEEQIKRRLEHCKR